MPALLETMSMPPNASTVLATAALTASPTATSAGTAIAFAPDAGRRDHRRAVGRAVNALHADEGDHDRAGIVGLAQHQAEKEIVPDPGELDKDEEDQRCPRHRKHDPPKSLP